MPCFVNGRLVGADEPAIAPSDQGFALGLAVFDTLLYKDHCVYFVEEHLERLRSGADLLGIPWPPPHDPRVALDVVADALDERTAALRITLSRGVPGGPATTVVTTRALEPYAPEGITIAISERAKLGTAGVERVKSTNRLRNVLALEEARARGAREALLPTEEGDYSEGTYTNLFIVRDGVVHTPAQGRGALAGIMRGKVLELLAGEGLAGTDREGRTWRCVEGRIEPADLAAADEVFLTSTLGRVIPVRRVLGLERDYPGSSGPLVRALSAAVADLEARYRAATANSAHGRDPR